MRSFVLNVTLIGSILTLLILSVFEFYRPYTGDFYFLKLSAYVLLVLAIVHLIFLYVLWFKIKEEELTDIPMRNLEYSLYAIFLFYIYKFYNSLFIMGSFENFDNHLIPDNFMTIQIMISILYFVLLALTFASFMLRKYRVGIYNFQDSDGIESWD